MKLVPFRWPAVSKTTLILISLSLLLLLAACTAQEPLTETVVPGSTETPGTQHGPGETAQILGMAVSLLAVAALVNLGAQRLHIPYTIGLVLIGLGLSLFTPFPIARISPEIILVLLLPPLLFEAAYHANLADLRRELPEVLTLAIPVVILTTVLVGLLVWLGAGIALPYALVFGALIAPTDPVAVVSLFRSLGAPRRLGIMLEGESLLNDGTSIVIYKLMLTFALAGQLSLGQGVVQFLLVAGGGLLVGAIAGLLVSFLLRWIDNHLVETALTTVLAYGSYLVAEYYFGVSGVLAVVTAGLAVHWLGQPTMSPSTQIAVFNFWEYAAFLANSFVFLLIGLQSDPSLLLRNLPAILWSILAVLVARSVIIYGLFPLTKRRMPPAWKLVLFWGGLRGGVSLALALSLTGEVELREQLVAMAFGVVLFTLVVQGLTLTPLVRKLGSAQGGGRRAEYERRQARQAMLRSAGARLQHLFQEGSVSEHVHAELKPIIEARLSRVVEEDRTALAQNPGLRAEARQDAWQELLRTQRSTLSRLYQGKLISEKVYEELAQELDQALVIPESDLPE